MNRLVQVEQALRDRGCRLTGPRRLVLRRAVSHLHFTAEELVGDVKRVNPGVARGTVYRTLAMLQEAGVIDKHDFWYGPPYYEVTLGKGHHDHLMCVQCGEIIEFQEPRVERLQQDIVKRFGYQLMYHTHKLYGLCAACQRLPAKPLPKHAHLHVEEVVA